MRHGDEPARTVPTDRGLVPRAAVLYDTSVDYVAFQDAVLELAGGGARLTKATVAARLDVEPARAGELLDRMTHDGRLELDIDERSGEIFYTPSTRRAPVKAAAPAKADLAKKPGAALSALRDLDDAASRSALAAKVGTALVLGGDGPLPPERRRKLALGVVLGGLFPGFGLAYAAPWPIVVAASLFVVAGAKVLALIPILSSFLVVPFLVVCAAASAIFGGMYTWNYNQTGKRSPLGDEPTSALALLKRARKK